MSDQTKPTHISTSEDDVAEVDVEEFIESMRNEIGPEYSKDYDREFAYIRQLAKENEKLKGHIQWMSGSPSFGPEGDAFKGWLKVRKEVFGQ